MRATNTQNKPHQTPIVIAHRGASGLRPEHTLAAYRLAILQQADFIEPDLVLTQDGHLIARHENELSSTTDVAERLEFQARKTTKIIDGVTTTGWFSEDFTLKEIKTLRAKERIPRVRPHNSQFDGMFTIPTLVEVIHLIREVERTNGRRIGIYPETKHPTYFAKEGTFLDGTPINMSLGEILINTLVRMRFTDPDRIFIQSFEFENLIELQNALMPRAGVAIPLVQLYGDITESCIQPHSNVSRPYDMTFNATKGADLRAIYGVLADLVHGRITENQAMGIWSRRRSFNTSPRPMLRQSDLGKTVSSPATN
jgi:glycerophosphoryl diester phosphodiesterase